MGEGISKEITPGAESDGANYSSVHTPKLIAAATNGQVDTVAKLLKKGKKVDKKDPKGDTALHKAAIHGHYEVADMLLKKGAPANEPNSEGFTPFQFAVLNGRKECAKLLLDQGTNVNAPFQTNPGVALDYSINKSCGVYVWRIHNFSKIQDKKLFSEIFSVVGHKWKLVVYPHGSKGDENLSCYLEIVDHENLPEGWCIVADFSFCVVNYGDGSKKIVREVHAHRFYKNHTDLGFPQLIKKVVLKDRKSGCLVNDTLTIEFMIEVLENSTCALDEYSGLHTWKLTDMSGYPDRAMSNFFKIGSCRWIIALYPHGKGGGSNLSIYLKVYEPMALPPGWSYLVNFRFSVVNQNDGSKFSRQVESKNFRHKVEDWGFPQFMKLTQLHEPGMGYVMDDSILVEVQVEIIREKRKKMKHNNPATCAFTPLHWATYKGAADGVKLLLAGGADISITDARGRTPLDWAAYLGDVDVATLLIEMGAKATCYDAEGYTPLHKAVLNGHERLMQILVEAGADVNAKSLNNTTPLQLAYRSNKIWIAELLVTRFRADMNCTDKNGRTPLHWAAFDGDLPIATFLVKNGANIDATDHDGYTPLHKALWKSRHECARYLLECGANVQVACNKGYTPLDIAVQTNDMISAVLVLDYGDDVNSADAVGMTLLHKAVQNGNLYMVDTLIKCGANIACDDRNPTPLQLAIANRDIPTCIYLLENGADIGNNTAALLSFVAGRASCLTPEAIPASPPNTLSKDLHSLVNHAQYHDVKFMIDDKPIYAWRGMLCARSDYFRAMFEKLSWKESAEASIEIKHVPYRTFLAVIIYIYTGEIDLPISVEDCLLLLAAANRYILPRLKTLCEKILVNELSPINVCNIFRLADLHMSSFLHKACVQYIAEHIDQVHQDELDEVLKVDSFAECIISFLRPLPSPPPPRSSLSSSLTSSSSSAFHPLAPPSPYALQSPMSPMLMSPSVTPSPTPPPGARND